MDALTLLTNQHQETDAAFRQYEGLAADAEQERIELARTIIEDLTRHAGIEEVAFYPTVQDALPDAADDIQEDLEEHQQAKELLATLDGADPSSDEYDATMRQLIEDVRHHVEEEENDLFPQVREALTAEELDSLGDTMERLMEVVPTRPHPHEPSTPPANTLTGPLAGALDRLRDAIRDRTQDRRV